MGACTSKCPRIVVISDSGIESNSRNHSSNLIEASSLSQSANESADTYRRIEDTTNTTILPLLFAESPNTNEFKNKDENKGETEQEVFKQYTLEDICNKIKDLSQRVPRASRAELIDPNSPTQVREWGESIEFLTDEYHLLYHCVLSATYKWGTQRSGAAEQNLDILIQGLETANRMINDAVKRDMTQDTMAPRKHKFLSNIVETEDKATGKITRTYIYGNDIEDEHIQRYIAKGLSRNAPLQRHVLLSAFDLTCRCMNDYIEASKKDNQTDISFAY